jgi:hypothetical protein
LPRRGEETAFAVLKTRPARSLMLAAAAASAAIGMLMMVISTLLEVVRSPFRHSLAIMTMEPSMQVTVPVGIDTMEPRDIRVGGFVVILPIFESVEVGGGVARSDATVFTNPFPAGVGLGMQK